MIQAKEWQVKKENCSQKLPLRFVNKNNDEILHSQEEFKKQSSRSTSSNQNS